MSNQLAGKMLPGKDPSTEQNFRRLAYAHDRHTGQILDVSTGVGAGTEFSVAHGLGYIPEQVEVLTVQGQTDAYLAVKPSGTTWTKTTVYLKCNTASATLRLRVS